MLNVEGIAQAGKHVYDYCVYGASTMYMYMYHCVYGVSTMYMYIGKYEHGVSTMIIIIIMVIPKCYFSGEQIAHSMKKTTTV